MTKINIKPKLLYFTTITIFVAIICFFTAIYPATLDEIRFSYDSWHHVLGQIKVTFSTDAPRLMNFIYICCLRYYDFWKLIFPIINPFVQLFIIFGMFFVITGKKINFTTTKDFYTFLLLCLMYLLLIPSPSNVFFWMAGALNYSWAFVPSLILLCLFRRTINGKKFKNSVLSNFLMCFCGFATGMSNENTAPMMLGLTVLFLIYCKYKKIKIPSFYYFALAGIILGLYTMFSSDAYSFRIKNPVYQKWNMLSIGDKLFTTLWHFNSFLNATFWVPVISMLGLILVFVDKKLQIVKNENFILSSLFCVCGFGLAFALSMVPLLRLRIYYSSAIFFFISFILLLYVIKSTYRLNLIKYMSLALLIMGIVVSPLITLPYVYLYKANQIRENTISQARKGGKQLVFVDKLIVLKGPTENWTIKYYDILWLSTFDKLKQRYKITLNYQIYKTNTTDTVPI